MEKIDDVRYIINKSSGKMGAAIAKACKLRGAQVLLLRSKNSPQPNMLVKEELFVTTEDLLELIKKYIKDYDVIYHTAAVSDFVVENSFQGKISSEKEFSLKLKPQIKIINQIKKLNPKIRLIAFKAEYTSSKKELVKAALDKLKKSRADSVVANDISSGRGFEVDENEVYVVLPDGKTKHFPLAAKDIIADQVVDYIEKN
jgi:phosphopantothenoylcysteine decarboxylase/phosphopantothenate--cysteine ligase